MRAATIGLGTVLFLGFAIWAFLKPPLQSPDEGAHLARALGVPNQPWIVGREMVAIRPADLTPFVDEAPPAPLAPIFFHRERHLSVADIDALKALPWPQAAPEAEPVPRRTGAWSYPAPYYIAVYAIGRTATRIFALEPYASLYAFRLASVLLAVPLWLWVWRRLGHSGDLRPWRTPLFLGVLLNPMLAFMTSSVNPDAVVAPLGALALLAAYEMATAGTRVRSALLIMLAALLAKPSGPVLALAVIGTIGALWVTRLWRPAHAWRAVLVIAAAIVLAFALHYAWSPTRTYGNRDPVTLTVIGTATWLVRRVWKTYWGMPGYLDYWLPKGWYAVLTLLWLANLAAALGRLRHRPPGWSAQAFVIAAAVCFTGALVAASMIDLSGMGFNLQGRYLFPIALGCAAALVHSRRLLRWSFLTCLALFHAALAHESVLRYFGDYAVFLHSLPWR